MSPRSAVEIPPRPSWMRSAPRPTRPLVVARKDPLPEDVHQRRMLREAGNLGSGVLLSAALHLAILLILNIWFFVTRPGPSGYVINCEILTEDEGARTPVNTVLHAALPDPAPSGGDIRLDLRPGGAAGEGKLARIGGGAGDADGAGGGGLGFFGTRGQGNTFVFVVDRSGSMKQDGRLTAAKLELNRAIGTLRPNQRFYVLFYNNGMSRMLGALAPAKPVFALPQIKDDVRRWMRPILAKGGTEPAESLETALAMRPDVIFFLTDGEIPEETAAVVSAENFHGTVVHTTALVSREGEATLQEIARQSGGTYRHIAVVPQMAADRQFAGNPHSQVGDPKTQTTQEELAAIAKLSLARKYLQEGRSLTGRRLLEKVIADYPGTSQALQAEQLLSAW